ncbi:uncharacterized protein PG998_005192 [Apiospora kogelbergensis]|uniref:uncharacterized protein n=1 Tax=Apiospora kogelbergensis TaxID=1337665 RepID=UPI00313028BD
MTFAEQYEMYWLVEGLLDYLKNRLKHLNYLLTLRYLLLFPLPTVGITCPSSIFVRALLLKIKTPFMDGETTIQN